MRKLLLTLSATILLIGCLGACNNAPQESTTQDTSSIPTEAFTVRFLNYDDSLLDTVSVSYGGTAIYSGSQPVKPATMDYAYIFNGWDKSLENVTANLDVKAVYEEKANIKEVPEQYDCKVLQGSTEINVDTTNFIDMMQILGLTVELLQPDYEYGDPTPTTHKEVAFEEIEFDYSQVDLNVVGTYEFTMTITGVSRAQQIMVIPDVSTWTEKQYYTGVGEAEHSSLIDPKGYKMDGLRLYNEGCVIESAGYGGWYPLSYEFCDDNKSIRVYSTIGRPTDAMFDIVEDKVGYYSYPGHEDVYAFLTLVQGETESQLKIHQSFEDAPTAYGSILIQLEFVGVINAKYTYDPTEKSLTFGSPAFMGKFVLNEEDGKYHC